MIIHDRLYRKIEVPEWVGALNATSHVQRLAHVSHDALYGPANFTSGAGSKLEHSHGVVFLAQIAAIQSPLTRNFEDRRVDVSVEELLCAAFLHDLGTPPFSHNAEEVMRFLHKRNHEEEAARLILEDRNFRTLLTKLGMRPRVIAELITGKGTFAGIINGTVDVDNLDGIPRYGLSKGIIQWPDAACCIQGVAGSYTLVGGKLGFLATVQHWLNPWRDKRAVVFQHIYGERHQVAEAMLNRAMQIGCWEEAVIKDNFFRLSDEAAFHRLRDEGSEGVSRIVRQLLNPSEHFRCLYRREIAEDVFSREQLRRLREGFARKVLADELCRHFDVPREHIATSFTRCVTHKPLPLFFDQDGQKCAPKSQTVRLRENPLLVAVFIAQECGRIQPEELKKVVPQILNSPTLF